MMGVFAEFERAMIAERVRAGLARGPGVRVNALGVPRSPPHSRNESVRLWRLLGGPVSASLPNGLALTPAPYSGSAALSSRTRSCCEAGQTVAAGARFRRIQVSPKDLPAGARQPEPVVNQAS